MPRRRRAAGGRRFLCTQTAWPPYVLLAGGRTGLRWGAPVRRCPAALAANPPHPHLAVARHDYATARTSSTDDRADACSRGQQPSVGASRTQCCAARRMPMPRESCLAGPQWRSPVDTFTLPWMLTGRGGTSPSPRRSSPLSRLATAAARGHPAGVPRLECHLGSASRATPVRLMIACLPPGGQFSYTLLLHKRHT